MTIKNFVGNKIFLVYFQSYFAVLHFNLVSWLPLLNYTKEILIECPLCAKHYIKDKDWWYGEGSAEIKAFTEMDRSFLISV